MIYAILLLGLIPAVLLPDILSDDDEGGEQQADAQGKPEETVDLLDLAAGDAEAPSEPAEDLLTAAAPDQAPPPEDVVAEEALLPVIEDDLPPATPPDQAEGALAPVIEDDVATGGTDPLPDEILQPVIDDDAAPPPPDPGFAAGDDAAPPEIAERAVREQPGMAVATETWLDDDELAAGSHVEIEGFDTGLDVLRITLDPEHDLDELEVRVDLAENGTDSEVWVGDMLFATLLDAPGAMPADVILQTRPAA